MLAASLRSLHSSDNLTASTAVTGNWASLVAVFSENSASAVAVFLGSCTTAVAVFSGSWTSAAAVFRGRWISFVVSDSCGGSGRLNCGVAEISAGGGSAGMAFGIVGSVCVGSTSSIGGIGGASAGRSCFSSLDGERNRDRQPADWRARPTQRIVETRNMVDPLKRGAPSPNHHHFLINTIIL